MHIHPPVTFDIKDQRHTRESHRGIHLHFPLVRLQVWREKTSTAYLVFRIVLGVMASSFPSKSSGSYRPSEIKKLSLSPRAASASASASALASASSSAKTITHSASLPFTTQPPSHDKASIAERRYGTNLTSASDGAPTPPQALPPLPIPLPSPLLCSSRDIFQLSPVDSIPSERSAPILIPVQKRNTSRPTTPLTAREQKGGHQFPFPDLAPSKPQISQSLRPTYQHQRKTSDRISALSSSPFSIEFSKNLIEGMHPDEPSSTHTPSSHLPPTTSTATLPSKPYGTSTCELGNGQPLLPFPRFHPANYQFPKPSSPTISRRSRPPNLVQPLRPLHSHHRHLSDAQQKLQQYQRDLVNSAARAANTASTSPRIQKPTKPTILPCGSPGTGPATPLMLEDTGDYMTAGIDRSQFPLGEGYSQDLVDKLIRNESERRSRAGLHSGGTSPAISPAGGRGYNI